METNIGLVASIATAFNDGGIWMYAILAVHIFTIAIMIERVYALYFLSGKNQKSLAKQFEEDIKKGRLDRVLGRTKSLHGTEPVASVIHAGALAAQDMGGRDEIQAKMDEVLAVENSRLERRTSLLAMLGNVGTLLGLLGTIIGLIQAFASVTNLNAAEKSIVLTKGVALAMNTTAYGLIVAIPALLLYGLLTSRTQMLQEDLNQASFKVFNWLSFNFEAVPTRPSRPNKSS